MTTAKKWTARILAVPVFAAIAAAVALAVAAAVPASATVRAVPLQSVHAVTMVTDRPDSGNGGTWADDTFTRAITITRTGGAPGAWTYTAVLSDSGMFTTIKGALTPNQGGLRQGEKIQSQVTGTLHGYAGFSFTASNLPTAAFNAGVPLSENDHGNPPADSTSTWYELAFPAGTTFGGAGIGAWSWTYTAYALASWPDRWHPALALQVWVDASDNGDGNLQGDGNIEG